MTFCVVLSGGFIADDDSCQKSIQIKTDFLKVELYENVNNVSGNGPCLRQSADARVFKCILNGQNGRNTHTIKAGFWE